MVSYILRECFVTSGLHLQMMASGILLAFPSILAPALTGDHPKMRVSEDELNTIMGVYFLTSPLGYTISPWVMQRFGRKITNISICVCAITGAAFVAAATNPTALIVGRGLNGITFCGFFVSCCITAEYTHPRRRGFHIVIKGVSSSIGESLCHSLGLSILTYQQTALLALIPAVLGILITLKWPESPQYLAYKGRYDECTAAFEWVRGTDSEAKKELQELILAQKERTKLDPGDMISRFKDAVRSKGFWMPMFLVFWVDIALVNCGHIFIVSYVTEIVNMLTGDRVHAYYYTVVLNVMKTLCVLVSSIIVRFFNRRTVLFVSGSISSSVLVILCLLYRFDRDATVAFKWVTPMLFVAYYVIVNVAIVPVTIVIQGELIPIKYKGVGTFISGMLIAFFILLIMNWTWKVLNILDLDGMFWVYFIIFSVSYVVLLIYLPETKDRTLQDIETEFVLRNTVDTDLPNVEY